MSIHHDYMVVFDTIITTSLFLFFTGWGIYTARRYTEVFHDKPHRQKHELLKHYKFWFYLSCIIAFIFLVLTSFLIHELFTLREI